MLEAVRRLRSALALVLVLLLFPIGAVPFYAAIVPLAWARPAWRPALIAAFMKGMCVSILGGLRLGGARFRLRGHLPTREPTLIVANHQSLLDICMATLISGPRVPAFVTRKRYARFIPLVSPCVRMLGGPIVDPEVDRRGAVSAIRRGARSLDGPMLIFPEGHRTRDGSVSPFKGAGIRAALEVRRMPVYLLVGDGLWKTRGLVDFVFKTHLLRGEMRVVGPMAPPEDDAELEPFVRALRSRLVEELEAMRAGGEASSSGPPERPSP